MPLRDHFRPPVSRKATWDALHGMWPAAIVQQLRKSLPKGYVAAPTVHPGSQIEVDVGTYENDDAPRLRGNGEEGGVATATWAPPAPAVAVETALPDEDEYSVRVYDAERGRQLVAVIEIVSPGNKDRPDKRNAFVGKCAGLLRAGVAVTVVDVVTPRQFNLYADLMAFVGHPDPAMGADPPHLYAASCRWLRREPRALLQAWPCKLEVGQPFPTLPLWLAEALVVPLDLERSYEQACHDLWIA